MKISRHLNVVAFLVLFTTNPFFQVFSARYYVTSEGAGTGTSWTDALNDIQSALSMAVSGDEIWVKTGTYFAHASDSTVSFSIPSGVKLYGGFQGTEASISDRTKSDLDGNGTVDPFEYTYASVLSGEIQSDGAAENNTQHIVTIPSGAVSSTLINGFKIEGGYAHLPISGPSGTFVYASGIFAQGGSVEECTIVDCQTVTAESTYGGGVFAYNTKISKSEVNSCNTISTGSGFQIVSLGGGIYAGNSSVVESCYISSCSNSQSSGKKALGGGLYSSNSTVINSTVINCSVVGSDNASGYGGGVYASSSSIINSVVTNCEATDYGAGINILNTFIANSVIAKNKCINTLASGGGIYAEDASSTIYNTVFWGNQSNYFRNVNSSMPVVKNCALEDEDLVLNGNISISASNTGSSAGVLYPEFISPTSFLGTTGGDAAKEASLLNADWNISYTSDLIEKGDNTAFNEPHPNVNKDLNGDGSITANIDQFKDLAGEMRLFNKFVDIGAYEPAFIDLQLPTTPTIQYGTTLGEIVFADGKAIDKRDGQEIAGVYSFTLPSEMPPYTGEIQKYKIEFTPEDLLTYPSHYDSLDVIVTAKILTLSGITADDKEYNAATDVTFSGTAVLTGVVGSDDVTLNTGQISAVFVDKHAGPNKPVEFSGYTLSGADKDNYILSLTSVTAAITPKSVTMATPTIVNKEYDGTLTAQYVSTPALSGVIAGDDATLDESVAVMSFDTKDIGVNKVVSFSGFALAGADKDNYQLSQPSSTNADIFSRTISVQGVSVEDKVYDGTINAYITGTAVLGNLVVGDDVTLVSSSAAAQFTDKNVGAGKSVTFMGYTLSGTDVSNYIMQQPSATAADITSKELTIAGISVYDKQYDGALVAQYSGTASLEGVVTGDDVSVNVSAVSASFAGSDVGATQDVIFSGFSLLGNDISNYSIVQPVLSGDIVPRNIYVAADAKLKAYGVVDPELTYMITSGTLIASDTFSGNLVREVGEYPGSYVIQRGTLSLSTNYNLVFTTGIFTIVGEGNVISFTLDNTYDFEKGKVIDLMATSSSGSIIQFISSDDSVASISGSKLTFHTYGTVTITASDAGNKIYAPAAKSIDLTLNLSVEGLQKGNNMVLINNYQEQFKGYQWYKDGVPMAGETNQYYYTSEGLSGEYYCEVTTIKDETFNSNTLLVNVQKALEVYPSPALKSVGFNVEVKGFDQSELSNSVLKVYSLAGILVQQVSELTDVNAIYIDNPGIYLLQTEGAVNVQKKIMIK
jgi:hypothetical protein